MNCVRKRKRVPICTDIDKTDARKNDAWRCRRGGHPEVENESIGSHAASIMNFPSTSRRNYSVADGSEARSDSNPERNVKNRVSPVEHEFLSLPEKPTYLSLDEEHCNDDPFPLSAQTINEQKREQQSELLLWMKKRRSAKRDKSRKRAGKRGSDVQHSPREDRRSHGIRLNYAQTRSYVREETSSVINDLNKREGKKFESSHTRSSSATSSRAPQNYDNQEFNLPHGKINSKKYLTNCDKKFSPDNDKRVQDGVPQNGTINPIKNGNLSENDGPHPIAPAKKNEPTFKYQEVVRGYDKRRALPGHECEQCRLFHNAIVAQTGGEMFDRCQMIKECSRHRARYEPESTPPDFWELSFADSVAERKIS